MTYAMRRLIYSMQIASYLIYIKYIYYSIIIIFKYIITILNSSLHYLISRYTIKIMRFTHLNSINTILIYRHITAIFI